MADEAYFVEKQSFFVMEDLLQKIVDEMVVEVASSQIQQEKQRRLMRINIKQQAQFQKLKQAKQQFSVYDKVKTKREQYRIE